MQAFAALQNSFSKISPHYATEVDEGQIPSAVCYGQSKFCIKIRDNVVSLNARIGIIVSVDNNFRHSFKLALWLFIKLLGIIFLIAFASLSSQILGLAGSEGILPVANQLNEYRDQYGAVAPIFRPSLFWFNSSDSFLKALTVIGMGSSVALILGILPGVSLLLCWLLYLSFKNAVVYFLGFQWDDMLLECGLLTLFAVPWSLVDPVIRKKTTHDHPQALFLLRWMLFRVMFCSGMVKLLGGCSLWLDFSALGFYWETQLLPNQLAWYLFALPKWFQTIGVFVTFVMELIFPFLIFAPRRLRIAAAIALIFLQVAMLGTGNHGFINILTAILCLILLDDHCLKRFIPEFITKNLLGNSAPPSSVQGAKVTLSGRRKIVPRVAVASFVCVTAFSSIATFWPKSSFSDCLRPALNVVLGGYHLTGRYGLYPVVSTERLEIVVEGSEDGQNWQPYSFEYHLGALDKPPPSLLLHQPRLDWRMRFAALGTSSTNPWLNSFTQRLLQGSQSVLSLLEKNPFPDRPPKYIRADLYIYQFTTEHDRRTTGNWWRRQFVEHYLPATKLNEPGERPMAFADSWYPAEPAVLQKMFEELKKRAQLRPRASFAISNIDKRSQEISAPISAIVVPHAAYRYSGIAAMRAYLEAKQNGPRNLKRIILLGPLHAMYDKKLSGAVLPSDTAFATPFGKLKLDTEAIQHLANLPNFVVNERVHDVEHSLEMQLPLVRYIFKDVPIVPVLITNTNNLNSISSIANGLRSILNDGDLVITSGDMTHWGAIYNYEPFTENVRDNVQKLDEEAYSHIACLDNEGFSAFHERTKEHMCCFEPVSVLIDLLPKDSHATVIDYYTSQDAMPKPLGGESKRCVGYLSIGFSGGHWQKNKEPAKMH